MVSTRHGRIGGERIEAENPVHHAGIDAAVDPDRKPVRQIEAAQQHLDALCARAPAGSSSSTRPFFGSQPPMSATTKKRVSGTCTMVRGKISPSSFSRDQTGADSRAAW